MVSQQSPLPKRLRALREARGLSQKQLGIKAGIDEFSASPRMNQYETGRHTPDYLTLERIAAVLKTSPSYFYTDDDDLAKIIHLYGRLNRKEKKSFRENVAAFCEPLKIDKRE